MCHMEQLTPEVNQGGNIPFRLLKGICEDVLNVGRFVGDAVNIDPSPDAMSHYKPGLLGVIHQIRQERQGQ